jgi:NADH:ubiquinone oxidoreductase subunit 6 (subunit J)
MFIGVDRAEHIRERLPFQRQTAAAALIVLVMLTGLMLRSDQWSWVLPEGSGQEANGTIEAIGSRLIAGETEEEAALGIDARGWLLPFEATSILLVIASVGAISLAFYRPRRIASVERLATPESPSDSGGEG